VFVCTHSLRIAKPNPNPSPNLIPNLNPNLKPNPNPNPNRTCYFFLKVLSAKSGKPNTINRQEMQQALELVGFDESGDGEGRAFDMPKDNARQDSTAQDSTAQDKTKQYTAKQGKTR
jgi:hypothetical protein